MCRWNLPCNLSPTSCSVGTRSGYRISSLADVSALAGGSDPDGGSDSSTVRSAVCRVVASSPK